MSTTPPKKVLIADGKPGGGLASFAEALRYGFAELGLPAEVAAPSNILRRPGELRDPEVLKILSTSAVFAAPFSRRAMCMAHGIPCAELQGWPTTLAVLASFRLATASRGSQLVAVSEYSALHLRAIFGLHVDAVIHNPVHPLFLEAMPETESEREAIIYAGRLHCSKNIDRLLPAMRDVLDENPGLVAWIVGDGPIRSELERIAAGDTRIEFLGTLTANQVRSRLRRSRVFVSACPTEAFGIAYIEALSQGCAVAMPISGGGLEIAPELIGSRIQLFATLLTRGGIASALRKALLALPKRVALSAYSPRSVAEAYLAAEARFNTQGIFQAEAGR
jgi:glycosyltransferase involved in cell wall biosynthesis